MEHHRGDTIRTRSSVNRDMRNEIVNCIWVTEKIWRIVKYGNYELEEVKGS